MIGAANFGFRMRRLRSDRDDGTTADVDTISSFITIRTAAVCVDGGENASAFRRTAAAAAIEVFLGTIFPVVVGAV